MKVNFSFDLDTILKTFILYVVAESKTGLTTDQIQWKVKDFLERLEQVI